MKWEADGAREKAKREGEAECVLQLYLFENRSTSEDLIRFWYPEESWAVDLPDGNL